MRDYATSFVVVIYTLQSVTLHIYVDCMLFLIVAQSKKHKSSLSYIWIERKNGMNEWIVFPGGGT